MPRLDRGQTIAGHTFRAGTEVVLDDAGRLASAFLQEPHVLAGIPCRGRPFPAPPESGMIAFAPDRVRFHAGGAIAELVLAAEHEHRGVTCQAGSWLSLYADGALHVFTLAAPAVIDGLALPAGARVQLFPDGRLLHVSRGGALDVQGFACDGTRQDVGFHASGKAASLTLARATSYRDLPLPAGTHLVFDEHGELTDVFSPEPLEFRGQHAPAGRWVRIDGALRFVESPLASIGR